MAKQKKPKQKKPTIPSPPRQPNRLDLHYIKRPDLRPDEFPTDLSPRSSTPPCNLGICLFLPAN